MDVQACSLLLHLWEHPTYPVTAFPHSSSLSPLSATYNKPSSNLL